MIDRSLLRGRALYLAAGLALALTTRSAVAQSPTIEVRVGASVLFMLPRQAQIIDSEDRTIATFQLLPDGHGRVTGVSVGHTRIIGRDPAQVPMIFPVNVVAASSHP